MLFFMLFPALVISFLWKCYQKFKKTKPILRGRHICVTGGSSGIGKSVALAAARMGAHVSIIARNKQRLDEAIAEIKAVSSDDQHIAAISLDCSDHAKVIPALEKIDDELPIFMFVNCAGFAACGVFEDLTIDEIQRLFNVNYFATVYPLKAVIPRMKARNEGIVVITGSQGGQMGIYGLSVYASTKFALRGLAESLRMECGEHNVSVTLALPPDTDTPGFETENKNKPLETALISNAGGLFKPDVVANKMLNDALMGNFFSSVGFESWIMTTLCVGMSPFMYFFDVLLEASLLGPLRLISSYYITSFQKVVADCKNKRNKTN